MIDKRERQRERRMGQQATHTLGLRSLVKFARENVPLFARLLARGLQTPRIWMSKYPIPSHRARKVILKHRDVPREIRARIFSHAILRATLYTRGKKNAIARAKPNRATTASARSRARCVETSFVRAKRLAKRERERERERTHHDDEFLESVRCSKALLRALQN